MQIIVRKIEVLVIKLFNRKHISFDSSGCETLKVKNLHKKLQIFYACKTMKNLKKLFFDNFWMRYGCFKLFR